MPWLRGRDSSARPFDHAAAQGPRVEVLSTHAEHPADANYKRLHCELEPASAEEVAMVEEYTKKTHAKTHNSYRLKVKHVFRAKREGEAEAFEKHQSKARQLLWRRIEGGPRL